LQNTQHEADSQLLSLNLKQDLTVSVLLVVYIHL